MIIGPPGKNTIYLTSLSIITNQSLSNASRIKFPAAMIAIHTGIGIVFTSLLSFTQSFLAFLNCYCYRPTSQSYQTNQYYLRHIFHLLTYYMFLFFIFRHLSHLSPSFSCQTNQSSKTLSATKNVTKPVTNQPIVSPPISSCCCYVSRWLRSHLPRSFVLLQWLL